MLLELLCDMNDYRNATRAEFALYRQACDWIEKNAERAITSQEVAIVIGCSRAYLNRVVTAACGECLSDVIAQYRLERIKNFCDSGGISVSEIAHRLGFYSTELLCKFFKYHEGVSINKYKTVRKCKGEIIFKRSRSIGMASSKECQCDIIGTTHFQ